MSKDRVQKSEIITVCPKDKDQILKCINEIELAMTKDIPLVQRYGFPECLSMSVGISAGDNWGGAMDIDQYLQSF